MDNRVDFFGAQEASYWSVDVNVQDFLAFLAAKFGASPSPVPSPSPSPSSDLFSFSYLSFSSHSLICHHCSLSSPLLHVASPSLLLFTLSYLSSLLPLLSSPPRRLS